MKKRIFAMLLTLVLLVTFFSVRSLPVTAADDTDGKFTYQELRLDAETSGLRLPIIESAYVLLADRYNNIDQEGSTVYIPEGTIAFYYSAQDNVTSVDGLTKFTGTDTHIFYNQDDAIASKLGLANNRYIAYFEGAIDTSHFKVGDHIYIYDVYTQKDASDRYAAMDGTVSKSRNVIMVAATKTDIFVAPDPVYYGDTVTLSAVVTSTYTGDEVSEADIVAGTLEFFVDGTSVGTVTTSEGKGSVQVPADMVAGVKDYDVTVTFTPANDRISYPSKAIDTFSVLPRPITIKPENVYVSVGDPFPTAFEPELSAGNFAAGDTYSTLGVIEYRTSVTDTSGAGIWNIEITNADTIRTNNPNYDITFAKGNLTVSPVNEAPAVSGVTYTGNEPLTNQNVPISFKVSDDKTSADKLGVTIVNSKGQAVPDDKIIREGNKVTFDAEANDTYTVTAADEQGLTSAPVNIVVTNIDKVPPVIDSVTPSTDIPAESVKLTVSVSDTIELAKVTVEKPDGTVDNYSVTGTSGTVLANVTANGSYRITVTDKAGNSKQTSVTVDNIIVPGKTETKLTVSDTVYYGDSALLNAAVDVKEAGVNVSREDILKGTLEFFVGGVSVGTATANDGKASIELPASVIAVAKDYGVSAVFTPESTRYSASSEAAGTLTVLPRPITVKVEDVELKEGDALPSEFASGLKAGSFAFDDTLSTLGVIEYRTPVTDTDTAGTWNIVITNEAAIKAGNPNYDIAFEEGVLTVLAVNKAPYVSNVTYQGDEAVTNQDVSISFDVSDDRTSVDKLAVTVINSKGEAVPDKNITRDGNKITFTVDANDTYTVTVADEEGLVSEPVDITVTNIDKQPAEPEPTEPAEPEPTEPQPAQPQPAPATGDTTPVGLYVVLLAAALVAMVFSARKVKNCR